MYNRSVEKILNIFSFFEGGSSMRNYYALMNNNKVSLAAAYAILENNGESVLFRTFDDVLNVTYRIQIAEELVKNEEKSKEKDEIIEEIEWYKKHIRKNIREKKALYASVIVARYATKGQLDRLYTDVINAFERENELDFYDWIFEIGSIR